MEGHLTLSKKERERLVKFEEVKAGRMSLQRAAERLGLSYRQVRRAYRRFCEQGALGLVHRRRGRVSNRRLDEALKEAVLERYRERYKGFGPTLAAEELAKEGFKVDHETLRRWLLSSGDWQKSRRRREHRTRRQRRPRFGELVQLDGSHHAWLGEGDRRYCLLNRVDDATGTTLSVMGEEETTELAMRALWMWVERYGIPQALYTDKKSVYVTDREPTPEEQLAGKVPLTAFGDACAKLSIAIIAANSPQAKGRVERNHGVYQDRLVKLLALEGITTLEGANAFLEGGFTHGLNEKFARPAADPVDAHRPVPRGLDLADVFCFEETRTVLNDGCIRHENRFYQIREENRPLPKPKDKVVVRTRLDGTRALLYRDKPLAFTVLEAPPKKTARAAVPSAAPAARSPRPSPRPTTPGAAPSSPEPRRSPHDARPSRARGGAAHTPPEFSAFWAASEAGKRRKAEPKPGLAVWPPATALGSRSRVALSSGRAGPTVAWIPRTEDISNEFKQRTFLKSFDSPTKLGAVKRETKEKRGQSRMAPGWTPMARRRSQRRRSTAK